MYVTRKTIFIIIFLTSAGNTLEEIYILCLECLHVPACFFLYVTSGLSIFSSAYMDSWELSISSFLCLWVNLIQRTNVIIHISDMILGSFKSDSKFVNSGVNKGLILLNIILPRFIYKCRHMCFNIWMLVPMMCSILKRILTKVKNSCFLGFFSWKTSKFVLFWIIKYFSLSKRIHRHNH